MAVTEIRPGQLRGVPKRSNVTALLFYDADQVELTDSNETTVFTATLLADTLSDDDTLRIEHWGRINVADSGAPTLTLRLKLGGTTLLTFVTSIFTNPTTDQIVKFHAILKADASTAVQRALGTVEVWLTALGTAYKDTYALTGTGAEDFTTNLTLLLTAQLSAGTADKTYNAESTSIEFQGQISG